MTFVLEYDVCHIASHQPDPEKASLKIDNTIALVTGATFNKIEAVMAGLLGCVKHRISGGPNGYMLRDSGELRRRWNTARFAWTWDTSSRTAIEPEKPPF